MLKGQTDKRPNPKETEKRLKRSKRLNGKTSARPRTVSAPRPCRVGTAHHQLSSTPAVSPRLPSEALAKEGPRVAPSQRTNVTPLASSAQRVSGHRPVARRGQRNGKGESGTQELRKTARGLTTDGAECADAVHGRLLFIVSGLSVPVLSAACALSMSAGSNDQSAVKKELFVSPSDYGASRTPNASRCRPASRHLSHVSPAGGKNA